MLPLHQLPPSQARALHGVLFDLDDTFLDDGHLREEAYSALFALKRAGLRLIALTGRPAAWAELVARMWPVEAAIAENGALAFRREGHRTVRIDTATSEERSSRRAALLRLVDDARAQVPALVPADDVDGRVSDFTFDIGEHERASEETIATARAIAAGAGARTTRSSVHLHFTFDRSDKATGALAYLRSTGDDETRARQHFAFIGDSENDAPAFAAFSCTIGVANVRGHFSIPPRYVTPSPRSTGFCESAAHLIQARRS